MTGLEDPAMCLSSLVDAGEATKQGSGNPTPTLGGDDQRQGAPLRQRRLGCGAEQRDLQAEEPQGLVAVRCGKREWGGSGSLPDSWRGIPGWGCDHGTMEQEAFWDGYRERCPCHQRYAHVIIPQIPGSSQSV